MFLAEISWPAQCHDTEQKTAMYCRGGKLGYRREGRREGEGEGEAGGGRGRGREKWEEGGGG